MTEFFKVPYAKEDFAFFDDKPNEAEPFCFDFSVTLYRELSPRKFLDFQRAQLLNTSSI